MSNEEHYSTVILIINFSFIKNWMVKILSFAKFSITKASLYTLFLKYFNKNWLKITSHCQCVPQNLVISHFANDYQFHL